MRSWYLSIFRFLVCLFALPLLAVFAAFLICYSPIYWLASLFTNSKAAAKIQDKIDANIPVLTKLEFKHA